MQKNIFIQTQDLMGEDIFIDLTRIRNTVWFGLGPSIEGQFSYDQEVMAGSYLTRPEFIASKHQSAGTWLDLDTEILDHDDVLWRHSLYRGYMELRTEILSLSIGRQRIDWAVTRLWNPLDLFNPILPQSIEQTERVGVDAVNFELFLSDLSKIQFVYAPQDSLKDSSMAGRYIVTVGTYDYSLMFGEFRNAELIGISFDGYIKDAGFRGEATVNLEEGEDFIRASIGYDYTFANGVYALLEYFYNGKNKDVLSFDNQVNIPEIITVKKNFLGIDFEKDITALWRIQNLSIIEMETPGIFNGTYLSYSASKNIDVTFGIQLSFSGNGGDFDLTENIYFAQLECFF
ncbi:MAG: hypothetical protein Q8Q33_00530 [Chlamydiota bacterium]|nr:hypothetical protein [Chlamydiota bacterium]